MGADGKEGKGEKREGKIEWEGERGRERRGRGKEGKGIVVSSASIHTNTNVFLLTHYTIYGMLFIVNLQTYTFRS